MPLTRQERNDLVRRLIQTEQALYDPDQVWDYDVLERMSDDIEEMHEQYSEGLPAVGVSRCPYCREELALKADFFGLDGPFWGDMGEDVFVSACPHFLTYLGALDLRGHTPTLAETGIYNQIHAGPAVPFIVPRLMAIPGMACVLSARDIVESRYRAYFMAYFANPPAPAEQGHQYWLRTQHMWNDPVRGEQWKVCGDAWDFDLGRWLGNSRIAWIAPNDTSLALQAPAGCPYVGLPGRRHPVILHRGTLADRPAPTGQAPDLFD